MEQSRLHLERSAGIVSADPTMHGYENIQADQAWIRLSDVIWQVSFLRSVVPRGEEEGLISF